MKKIPPLVYISAILAFALGLSSYHFVVAPAIATPAEAIKTVPWCFDTAYMERPGVPRIAGMTTDKCVLRSLQFLGGGDATLGGSASTYVEWLDSLPEHRVADAIYERENVYGRWVIQRPQ